MSRISKTVFTFTVLHPTDSCVPRQDLAEILQETDTGCAVGQVTQQVTTEVPEGDVRSELIALGNDGEFFDWGEYP